MDACKKIQFYTPGQIIMYIVAILSSGIGIAATLVLF